MIRLPPAGRCFSVESVSEGHPPRPVLPRLLPVMRLEGFALFPGAVAPLYIFEPRYRAMLAWALENDRMFVVACPRADGGTEQVAGAGLIRACVAQPDGTSRLLLQGMVRVRLGPEGPEEPFPMQEVEELRTDTSGEEHRPLILKRLRVVLGQVLARAGNVPEDFASLSAQLEDAEVLGDLMAHALVRDPGRRQQVLSEPRLNARLELLGHHLQQEWQV